MGHAQHIAGVPALWLSFACGAESADVARDEVPQDLGRCLSCDTAFAAPQDGSSAVEPKVKVEPTELMFYPWSLDSPEFEPKAVVVTNLTSKVVVVTEVQIGDDPKQSQGGSAYFAVEPLTEKIFLDKGEQTTFWVSYLGSIDQQSAIMVINTTDPVYHSLAVFLTGKFFIDASGS